MVSQIVTTLCLEPRGDQEARWTGPTTKCVLNAAHPHSRGEHMACTV